MKVRRGWSGSNDDVERVSDEIEGMLRRKKPKKDLQVEVSHFALIVLIPFNISSQQFAFQRYRYEK